MYTFVILLRQSRCAELNYMNSTLIMNVSSRMKFSMHFHSLFVGKHVGLFLLFIESPTIYDD